MTKKRRSPTVTKWGECTSIQHPGWWWGSCFHSGRKAWESPGFHLEAWGDSSPASASSLPVKECKPRLVVSPHILSLTCTMCNRKILHDCRQHHQQSSQRPSSTRRKEADKKIWQEIWILNWNHRPQERPEHTHKLKRTMAIKVDLNRIKSPKIIFKISRLKSKISHHTKNEDICNLIIRTTRKKPNQPTPILRRIRAWNYMTWF